MSRLDRSDEFTDAVFTRDRRSWWADMAGSIPGINVCTAERLTVPDAFDTYLPWTVRKVELYDPETFDASGVFAHKRSDTGAMLGTSTDRFSVMQNHEVRDLFTEALNGADYAVASIGALRHGALTFVSVDFQDRPSINAGGQTIHPFLSLINYHNGHGSVRSYASGIRPECLNTISLGWLTGVKLGSIAHTTKMRDRVPALQAEIRRYLDLAPKAEQMIARLMRPLSPVQYRKAIDTMTPIPDPTVKDGKVKNQQAITMATRRRDEIIALATTDDRVGFHGTAWGLFQAFSTWDQHVRGFRQTATSGVSSRRGASMIDHFDLQEERLASKHMEAIIHLTDLDTVKVTKAGLVAV